MNLKINNMGNKAATWLRPVWSRVQSMVRDDAAVTAIEYALLAALIAMVILVAVTNLGSALSTLWTSVSDAVNGAT